LNSLQQIDPDLQATLLGNVVVTGGTTLLPGFVERLQNEISAVAPGLKVKIRKFFCFLFSSLVLFFSPCDYVERS
jgi:actin-related protein